MITGSRTYLDQDKQGNQLFYRIFHDGKKDISANILLQLAKEKKPRLIGKYHFVDKTLYTTRKMSKHYHYGARGFGFNYKVICEDFLDIKKIHLVVDDTKHYIFSKSIVIDYGLFMNFKQKGFELQRFISLDLIKLHNKFTPDESQPIIPSDNNQH